MPELQLALRLPAGAGPDRHRLCARCSGCSAATSGCRRPGVRLAGRGPGPSLFRVSERHTGSPRCAGCTGRPGPRSGPPGPRPSRGSSGPRCDRAQARPSGGLVRARRQPGDPARPGVRPGDRRPGAGGLARRARRAARRARAPARTWAPRSATPRCTTGSWSAAGTGWRWTPPGGPAGGRSRPTTTACWPGCGWPPPARRPTDRRRARARARTRPQPRRGGHRDRPLRAGGRAGQPARPVARRLAAPVLVHRAAGAQRAADGLPAGRGPVPGRGHLHPGPPARGAGAGRVHLPGPAHGDHGDRRRRGRRLGGRDARHPAAAGPGRPAPHRGDRGGDRALRPARLRAGPRGSPGRCDR